MPVVRSIYLYVISLISIWVLAAGLAGLLGLAFEGLGVAPEPPLIAGSQDTLAEQLSRSLALAVVGLVLWTIHWWLIERDLAGDLTDAERVFRGVYVGAVLLVATIISLTTIVDVVAQSLAAVLGEVDARGVDAEGIGWVCVAVAIWGYHARVLLRRDALWRRRSVAGSAQRRSGAGP